MQASQDGEQPVRASLRLRGSARLRQSILKWAFKGKLADQDPADEPASILLERIKAEREAAGTRQQGHPAPVGAGRPGTSTACRGAQILLGSMSRTWQPAILEPRILATLGGHHERG